MCDVISGLCSGGAPCLPKTKLEFSSLCDQWSKPIKATKMQIHQMPYVTLGFSRTAERWCPCYAF